MRMKRAAEAEPWQPIPLGSLSCACGCKEIMGIAPGDEPPKVVDLFLLRRGKPIRAWCAACWGRAFGAGSLTGANIRS